MAARGDAGPMARTTLPPGVDSKPTSSLRLTLAGVRWHEGRLTDVYCRVRWWGEQGPGTRLRPPVAGVPLPSGDDAAPGRSSATFAVCCSRPKLEAYLKDMGAARGGLVVEVVNAETHAVEALCVCPMRVVPGLAAPVCAGNYPMMPQDGPARPLGEVAATLCLLGADGVEHGQPAEPAPVQDFASVVRGEPEVVSLGMSLDGPLAERYADSAAELRASASSTRSGGFDFGGPSLATGGLAEPRLRDSLSRRAQLPPEAVPRLTEQRDREAADELRRNPQPEPPTEREQKIRDVMERAKALKSKMDASLLLGATPAPVPAQAELRAAAPDGGLAGEVGPLPGNELSLDALLMLDKELADVSRYGPQAAAAALSPMYFESAASAAPTYGPNSRGGAFEEASGITPKLTDEMVQATKVLRSAKVYFGALTEISDPTVCANNDSLQLLSLRLPAGFSPADCTVSGFRASGTKIDFNQTVQLAVSLSELPRSRIEEAALLIAVRVVSPDVSMMGGRVIGLTTVPVREVLAAPLLALHQTIPLISPGAGGALTGPLLVPAAKLEIRVELSTDEPVSWAGIAAPGGGLGLIEPMRLLVKAGELSLFEGTEGATAVYAMARTFHEGALRGTSKPVPLARAETNGPALAGLDLDWMIALPAQPDLITWAQKGMVVVELWAPAPATANCGETTQLVTDVTERDDKSDVLLGLVQVSLAPLAARLAQAVAEGSKGMDGGHEYPDTATDGFSDVINPLEGVEAGVVRLQVLLGSTIQHERLATHERAATRVQSHTRGLIARKRYSPTKERSPAASPPAYEQMYPTMEPPVVAATTADLLHQAPRPMRPPPAEQEAKVRSLTRELHTFQVHISGGSGLPSPAAPTGATVKKRGGSGGWDKPCRFVQYTFPGEAEATRTRDEATDSPSPKWGDGGTHHLLLPEGKLRGALRKRLTDSGGIRFELVGASSPSSSRVLATATLPPERVTELVKYAHSEGHGNSDGELTATRAYTLPASLTEFGAAALAKGMDLGVAGATVAKSRTLRVSIDYICGQVDMTGARALATNVAASTQQLPGSVSLQLNVSRAAGLEQASGALGLRAAGATAGPTIFVAAYVCDGTGKLSRPIYSPAAAPSWAPDIEFDKVLDLRLSRAALTSASAEVVVEVWHRPEPTPGGERAPDVFVGTSTIPLLTAISTQQGVTGWLPLRNDHGDASGTILLAIAVSSSDPLFSLLPAEPRVGRAPGADLGTAMAQKFRESVNMTGAVLTPIQAEAAAYQFESAAVVSVDTAHVRFPPEIMSSTVVFCARYEFYNCGVVTTPPAMADPTNGVASFDYSKQFGVVGDDKFAAFCADGNLRIKFVPPAIDARRLELVRSLPQTVRTQLASALSELHHILWAAQRIVEGGSSTWGLPGSLRPLLHRAGVTDADANTAALLGRCYAPDSSELLSLRKLLDSGTIGRDDFRRRSEMVIASPLDVLLCVQTLSFEELGAGARTDDSSVEPRVIGTADVSLQSLCNRGVDTETAERRVCGGILPVSASSAGTGQSNGGSTRVQVVLEFIKRGVRQLPLTKSQAPLRGMEINMHASVDSHASEFEALKFLATPEALTQELADTLHFFPDSPSKTRASASALPTEATGWGLHVRVECATGLPEVEADESEPANRLGVPVAAAPNAYVSYSLYEHLVRTTVVKSQRSPSWRHTQTVTVPTNLPRGQHPLQTSLEFKVWHRAISVVNREGQTPEVVGSAVLLGVATVDLSSLLCAGMEELSGWYHVTDPASQEVRGQIKVSLTPTVPDPRTWALPNMRGRLHFASATSPFRESTAVEDSVDIVSPIREDEPEEPQDEAESPTMTQSQEFDYLRQVREIAGDIASGLSPERRVPAREASAAAEDGANDDEGSDDVSNSDTADPDHWNGLHVPKQERPGEASSEAARDAATDAATDEAVLAEPEAQDAGAQTATQTTDVQRTEPTSDSSSQKQSPLPLGQVRVDNANVFVDPAMQSALQSIRDAANIASSLLGTSPVRAPARSYVDVISSDELGRISEAAGKTAQVLGGEVTAAPLAATGDMPGALTGHSTLDEMLEPSPSLGAPLPRSVDEALQRASMSSISTFSVNSSVDLSAADADGIVVDFGNDVVSLDMWQDDKAAPKHAEPAVPWKSQELQGTESRGFRMSAESVPIHSNMWHRSEAKKQAKEEADIKAAREKAWSTASKPLPMPPRKADAQELKAERAKAKAEAEKAAAQKAWAETQLAVSAAKERAAQEKGRLEQQHQSELALIQKEHDDAVQAAVEAAAHTAAAEERAAREHAATEQAVARLAEHDASHAQEMAAIQKRHDKQHEQELDKIQSLHDEVEAAEASKVDPVGRPGPAHSPSSVYRRAMGAVEHTASPSRKAHHPQQTHAKDMEQIHPTERHLSAVTWPKSGAVPITERPNYGSPAEPMAAVALDGKLHLDNVQHVGGSIATVTSEVSSAPSVNVPILARGSSEGSEALIRGLSGGETLAPRDEADDFLRSLIGDASERRARLSALIEPSGEAFVEPRRADGAGPGVAGMVAGTSCANDARRPEKGRQYIDAETQRIHRIMLGGSKK